MEMTLAVRKPSNKAHNKKLKRRRDGLATKCFEYGELDGVEIALFVRYTKRGDFYSYMSKSELPWLRDVDKMVRSVPGFASCSLNRTDDTPQGPDRVPKRPEEESGRYQEKGEEGRRCKHAGRGRSRRVGRGDVGRICRLGSFSRFRVQSDARKGAAEERVKGMCMEWHIGRMR
jgi:hypothetical protein